MERFITFIALEVLTGHWDGYGMNRNNYRIYNPPGDAGIVFMPHGMDLMFEDPEEPVIPEFKGIVAKALIATEMGKQAYLERAKALRSMFLTEGETTKRLDQLQARLRPALATIHPKAAVSHDRAVRILRKRIQQRIQFLETELK